MNNDDVSLKSLVQWLNSLPEVRAIIAADFEGKPVREQNLSEWRKGGYSDWQRRQETLDWLRQLKEEAGDMAAVMDSRDFNRHLAVITAADMAQTMRGILEKTADPLKRMECLAQLAGKFALLRREESNAARTQIAQEKWEREVAREEKNKQACGPMMPTQALLLQRMYIEMFSDTTVRALLPKPVADSGLLPGPLRLNPT